MTCSNDASLDKQIVSVRQLLSTPSLAIPAYQRPYKWTQQHLNELLLDVRRNRDKPAYRLGSIVFHQHTENHQPKLDIVDGQQRTLTLLLLVKAILVECAGQLQRDDLAAQLRELEPQIEALLQRPWFNSDISHYNLHHNYLAARRAVSHADFTGQDIDFLLNRCELVTFVLTDISEAFQFFDSQNARGRDLDPHDLLKAYHLREFPQQESHLKAAAVANWERLDSGTLVNTFATYLYRIRRWSRGKPAHHFTKSRVGVFKGVNLDRLDAFPYAEPLRIAHRVVDENPSMRFPFQLDQMIINGRRFFEMSDHYQQLIGRVINQQHHQTGSDGSVVLNGATLDPVASNIIRTLNRYPARTRTGDRYVRTLFDCALIFFIDKFGMEDVSAAVNVLFRWAYRCRLSMKVVQLATMDNYARNHNLFVALKNATQPHDILSLNLPQIKAADVKGTRVQPIIDLFRELKDYE